MILPDNISDETLEYAAQLIEEISFNDIAGTMARRKRDREDAALRMRAREELRAELAAHLRAMKSRPELSAIAVLRRLAELPNDRRQNMHLMDAWPLAWKGWLDIHAIVTCNSNSIPPETEYRISLTDRGQKALAAAAQLNDDV